MFTWKKLGRVFNPIDVKDKPWLSEFAQAPATLIFDTFIRVYFSCRPAPDENGQYVSYSAFIDLNRKNLFEIINIARAPILQLGERGEFDEFGTYPVSVARNGNDVVAYYGGWTRCESVPFNVAIGMAISKDNGETFTKPGNGPILSYSIHEPFVLSGPKIRRFKDRWYLFYIAGSNWVSDNARLNPALPPLAGRSDGDAAGQGKPEPVYKIRMAISDDGINWIKADKNLIGERIEENEAQASPDVFFYNNMYHMFFCYRYSLNFRGKEKGYRIGYASSEDLVNWTRDDSKAGIDVSENGWDSEMISYPHVFELDGNVYMLYLGNQVGRYGFGLARLQ